MTVAKSVFDKNINDLSILTTIYDYLHQNIQAFDIAELLRAEYILCISALDYYIHNRVRDGLMDKFNDTRKDPGNIRVSLKVVRLLMNENDIEEQKRILDRELKNVLSKDSYQSPSSIESAFGLIDINKIWSKIALSIGCKADDLRNELALIINRRNKIAHESDINFATGEKEDIDRDMLIDVIDFIKRFVDGLETLI